MVLNLQVLIQNALRIILECAFDSVWRRLKRWKALVGILFSSRAGLRVRFTIDFVHFYELLNNGHT